MLRYKKISVIGVSLIFPVVDLYQKLNKMKFSGNSKTQVSDYENGYSSSICLLSVAIIESFINRIKHFSRSKFKYEKSNLKFFLEHFKNQDLHEKITELYILRDSIIHNHLWSISNSFDKNNNEIKIYHKLIKIYGNDIKFKLCVNRKKRKTKLLSLNIVPIKIGKNDAKIVLKTLNEFLLFLESKQKFNIGSLHIYPNNGRSVSFPKFISKL